MSTKVWKVNLAALAVSLIPASPLIWLVVDRGYWYSAAAPFVLFLIFTAWMARSYS